MSGVLTAISNGVTDVGLFSWDAALTVYNLITPSLPKGKVVPSGHPGEGGKWPEYIPPKEGDSRSACPGLNAMANHGILPRDGRNISFRDMSEKTRSTFNFSPTFCIFVSNYGARTLHRSYSTGTVDLEELNVHGGIEHDASLTREDAALQPDQGKPAVHLVKGLLGFATGKDEEGNPVITISDLSRYSAVRREQCKTSNDQYSLSKSHSTFGNANTSTLFKIFGGKVRYLEPFLMEERFVDGWEPEERSRMGITFATFNRTVFVLEKGIPSDPAVVQKLVSDAEAKQAGKKSSGEEEEEAGAAGVSTAVETRA